MEVPIMANTDSGRRRKYEQSDETGTEDAERYGKLQAELRERSQLSRRRCGQVVATGKKEIKEIAIDPGVVDADDVEMLQDLVLAAVNEALRKADEMVSTEMSRLTGGMGLGGLF